MVEKSNPFRASDQGPEKSPTRRDLLRAGACVALFGAATPASAFRGLLGSSFTAPSLGAIPLLATVSAEYTHTWPSRTDPANSKTEINPPNDPAPGTYTGTITKWWTQIRNGTTYVNTRTYTGTYTVSVDGPAVTTFWPTASYPSGTLTGTKYWTSSGVAADPEDGTYGSGFEMPEPPEWLVATLDLVALPPI